MSMMSKCAISDSDAHTLLPCKRLHNVMEHGKYGRKGILYPSESRPVKFGELQIRGGKHRVDGIIVEFCPFCATRIGVS